MSEILHEGKRLKFLIKTSPKKSKDIANSMNYKRLQGLAYYYRQPFIKKDTLYKFLETLGITENEFYNTHLNNETTETNNMVAEDTATYVSNRSYHQGKNLKRLLEHRFINISSMCDALQLNRANFYSYFKEPTLPEWLILQVSTILEIPASKITGEKSFNNKEVANIKSFLESAENCLDKITFLYDQPTYSFIDLRKSFAFLAEALHILLHGFKKRNHTANYHSCMVLHDRATLIVEKLNNYGFDTLYCINKKN